LLLPFVLQMPGAKFNSRTPLFALGFTSDESQRLQDALSTLLGRDVSDEERVTETLIETVEVIGARLFALENPQQAPQPPSPPAA
jgi:hypothetical protein